MAVVSTDELERRIRSVSGRAFAERRDLAIRLFVDTGMRFSELAGLRVENPDFDQDVAGVLGIAQMVGKRAMAAGLPHIHPH
ncbi:MAG TPA: tyrosine-type recombinase/integrase [Acidimicrobiia bacterium]|nr:tyrosine-type recombinase/integrase [Acidimicrobiia bacterium]